MDTGNLVRQRREAAGLTRKALGELVGVGEAMICHIETGKRGISPKRAAAFESALGVSKSELLPKIFGNAA